MKAMTQIELDILVEHLSESLAGAQLQDVLVNERGLLMEFYKRQSLWLLVDLIQPQPLLLDFEKRPPFIKAKPKPASLFLLSHGRNLYFKGIERLSDFGRVVRIYLGSADKVVSLEIRLIPKQVNFLVESDGKSIAWHKPKALQQQHLEGGLPEPRSLQAIREEWLGEQASKQKQNLGLDPTVAWEKQKAKDIAKKRKALEEIELFLAQEAEKKWQNLGRWLQGGRFGPCPHEELQRELSEELSHGEQIEFVFAKAKQISNKRQGSLERFKILQNEIAELEKKTFQPKALQRMQPKDLMVQAQARGRKLQLSDDKVAYIGKSAADNLSLLRKAKAWDMWVHLKDYPSAHAILHRKKDQLIPQHELEAVAVWLARESLQQKMLTLGQKLLVVSVECRYVRPIKGDKLGRVTYHSEKSFYVTL